jgi:hypothetical protein
MKNIILLENIEKHYPKVNCSKENTSLQMWSVLTFYPCWLLWHSLSYLWKRAWNTLTVKSRNMKEEFNTFCCALLTD